MILTTTCSGTAPSRLWYAIPASRLSKRQRTAQKQILVVRAAVDQFGDSRLTRKEPSVPKRLLSSAPTRQSDNPSSAPLTVYTVRFTTSYPRGSALSDPCSGVNLCLVGKDGNAILQRVSPVNDPQEARAQLHHICSIVDEGAGANCDLATASVAAAKPAAVKSRFQEGSVDEVSFLGPELGTLSSILVAPESGSWNLDEVFVCSSRTNQTDRFVCRQRLGGRGVAGAVQLVPVPLSAVVYGSGQSAQALSPEQAGEMRARNLDEYADMKNSLLYRTAMLAASGSFIMSLVAGAPAAVPFATGGMVAVVYGWMLQQGVDSIQVAPSIETTLVGVEKRMDKPARNWQPSPSPASRILGNSSVRLALMVAAGLAAVWGLQHPSTGAPVEAPASTQLLCGMAGFLSYKVAVMTTALQPAKVQGRSRAGKSSPVAQQQEQKEYKENP